MNGYEMIGRIVINTIAGFGLAAVICAVFLAVFNWMQP